jgi:glutamyl-tRNA reductase
MKGKVLVIGAGGVGTVVIYQMAAHPEVFKEIMLVSRTKSKCDAITKNIGDKRIKTGQIDAENVTSYKHVRNSPKLNKSRVNKSKVNVSEPSLHSVLQRMFLDYYLVNKQIEYYWQAKDGMNLKQLITKLKKYTDEDKIPDAFRVILEQNKDKWINNNLSISIINSKFNEIVSKIKGSTDPRLEEIERKFDVS